MTYNDAALLVLGILAVGATFWVYWKQSQKLMLIVNPISINLIDLESESKKQVREMLSVHWGERPIHKLDVTEVTISNDSKPISKEDFTSPLIISFGEAEILDAKIVEKNPNNMEVTILHQGSNVSTIMPLLNKGESFVVKVITNNLKDVSVLLAEARIKNGIVINKHRVYGKRILVQKLLEMWETFMGLLIIPGGFFVFFWFFGDDFGLKWNWEKFKDFAIFMTKLMSTLIGIGILFIFLSSIPRWFLEKK